jgi:transposase-like protein
VKKKLGNPVAADDNDDNGHGDNSSHITMLADVRDSITELLFPDGPVVTEPVSAQCLYDSFIHVRLCRFRVAGLSVKECARAVGISPQALNDWIKRFPRLDADLARAAALATTRAALLLQALMEHDNNVGLQAVKFFLETHSPAFRPRSPLDRTDKATTRDVAVFIRETIFGITPDRAVSKLLPQLIDSDDHEPSTPGPHDSIRNDNNDNHAAHASLFDDDNETTGDPLDNDQLEQSEIPGALPIVSNNNNDKNEPGPDNILEL